MALGSQLEKVFNFFSTFLGSVLLQSLFRVAHFVADIAIIKESVGEVLALHMVPHITLGGVAKLSTDLTAIIQISSSNKLVQILRPFRGKITT